ncbi:MAG: HEAT repeat domain-containing protein [Armatimonadota bacterium]
MNRRSVTLIMVIVGVIAAVYAITWWQRSRETQRLLEDLSSGDHFVATKAITGLRERAPAIKEELLQRLRGGDVHVRWRAAMLLRYAGGADVRDALVTALSDGYPDVRLNAALSLGMLQARRAIPDIARLAGNADEEVAVRAAAVRALAMLRAGDQLRLVSDLAADRPPLPPPPPAEGEEAVEVPPDTLGPVRQAAVRALPILAAVAQEAAGPLAETTEAPEAAEPGTAPAPPAGPALETVEILAASASALQEPNVSVRQAACYALGDLATLVAHSRVLSRALRSLVDASEDEASDVRIAAVYPLRLLPVPPELAPAVEQVMEAAVNDDHYWVRLAAEEEI